MQRLKNVKPQEKPFKLAAGRGLHLLVKTDGSKHWQFRFDAKKNTIAVGRYPEVSLIKVEKHATNALELLAGGINQVKIKSRLRLLKQVRLLIVS